MQFKPIAQQVVVRIGASSGPDNLFAPVRGDDTASDRLHAREHSLTNWLARRISR